MLLQLIFFQDAEKKVERSHPVGIFLNLRLNDIIMTDVFLQFIFGSCSVMYNVSGCCKVLPFCCCCCCTQREMGWVVGVSPNSQSASSWLDEAADDWLMQTVIINKALYCTE